MRGDGIINYANNLMEPRGVFWGVFLVADPIRVKLIEVEEIVETNGW